MRIQLKGPLPCGFRPWAHLVGCSSKQLLLVRVPLLVPTSVHLSFILTCLLLAVLLLGLQVLPSNTKMSGCAMEAYEKEVWKSLEGVTWKLCDFISDKVRNGPLHIAFMEPSRRCPGKSTLHFMTHVLGNFLGTFPGLVHPVDLPALQGT